MQYVVLFIQHFVDDISYIITGLYGFTLIFFITAYYQCYHQ